MTNIPEDKEGCKLAVYKICQYENKFITVKKCVPN